MHRESFETLQCPIARGRDFRFVPWALLGRCDRRFAPEGASADAGTGGLAVPLVVDRASLRPLKALAFPAVGGSAVNARKCRGARTGAAAPPATTTTRRAQRLPGGVHV